MCNSALQDKLILWQRKVVGFPIKELRYFARAIFLKLDVAFMNSLYAVRFSSIARNSFSWQLNYFILKNTVRFVMYNEIIFRHQMFTEIVLAFCCYSTSVCRIKPCRKREVNLTRHFILGVNYWQTPDKIIRTKTNQSQSILSTPLTLY